MKNSIVFCVLSVFISTTAFTQQSYIDSLQREQTLTQNDTIKLVVLRNIALIYGEIDPDSSYHYAEKSLLLARQLHLKLDEGGALREMGYALLNKGNYPRSLQTVLSAMAILENPQSERQVLVGRFPGDDDLMYHTGSPHEQRLSEIALAHQILGFLYATSNNYEKALVHHQMAMQNAEQSGNLPLQSTVNMAMGRVYLNLKKTDSSLISQRNAYEQALQSGYKRYIGSILLNMGRTYAAMGNKVLATEYFRKSIEASREHYYFRGVAVSNLLLAEQYKESSKNDSVFFHINEALSVAKNLDAPDLLLRSYTSLTDYYRNNGNNDSAVKYQALIIKINDSLFNVKRVQQFQNIDFDEQQRQQQIEAAKMAERAKFRTYLLLSGLAIFLVIAIILWRNSQHRKKANILLSRQKKELEIALDKLKTTQNQLIQSEKMASLGELTAGIAHEIQNPLNFVNNFSEINKELLAELKHEMKQGNINEANSIADDIINNHEKINHHGKRADAIVKGMLQHSRTSSGQKELTDINELTGEYSRLAYHGFKAKDKLFNAILKTDLDSSVGKIKVVPQEIGRVVFNLVNNAFYEVSEKARQNIAGYAPTVTISTKKAADKVELIVSDNGNGIPQNIIDKIFQPFFTTKPTGQGTGLGLSLSYDIVKAHGGEIKVRTTEGEGSEFIVSLPANTKI